MAPAAAKKGHGARDPPPSGDSLAMRPPIHRANPGQAGRVFTDKPKEVVLEQIVTQKSGNPDLHRHMPGNDERQEKNSRPKPSDGVAGPPLPPDEGEGGDSDGGKHQREQTPGQDAAGQCRGKRKEIHARAVLPPFPGSPEGPERNGLERDARDVCREESPVDGPCHPRQQDESRQPAACLPVKPPAQEEHDKGGQQAAKHRDNAGVRLAGSEKGEGSGRQPVQQGRFFQVDLPIDARNDPVPGYDHGAGGFGVTALPGRQKARLLESGEVDEDQDERENDGYPAL